MYQHTFTVFTPTYNRLYSLENVYTSLARQTYRKFEWIVVDDGSTDSTGEVVRQWQCKATFPIKYFFQKNGGKHRAFNRAVREAGGELFLTLDSDDECTPDALERFWFHWNRIPEPQRAEFSAVTALCKTPQGEIVGTRFPHDTFDSNSLELSTNHAPKGEKWGFHKTDVLKQFPFPEIEGENFITESVVWNRIAAHYKTRYVNEPLRILIQRDDGLTAKAMQIRAKNPLGAMLYYQERLASSISPRDRIKTAINYLRYSLHASRPLRSIARAPCSKTFLALLFPISMLVFVRDRRKLAADR